jgi:mannose-6-phosphate isomerase-like protein (cupin superfamily)
VKRIVLHSYQPGAYPVNGQQELFVNSGESAKHRLENRGSESLHIVEIQVGDYLGEDDIQRYEDNYGR